MLENYARAASGLQGAEPARPQSVNVYHLASAYVASQVREIADMWAELISSINA